MALVRPVFCELRPQSESPPGAVPNQKDRDSGLNLPSQKVRLPELVFSDQNKIVLQPRVCTLRTYGSASDPPGFIKTTGGVDGEGDQVSRFFATLSDYIESSRKSQDFEIISGRLAMVVFAATVSSEVVTGSSVLRKLDLAGIEEAGGACLAAVTCAAVFAWFSSNRNRVGRIFTLGCNSFIDSFIDQIVDGLFYDDDDDQLGDV